MNKYTLNILALLSLTMLTQSAAFAFGESENLADENTVKYYQDLIDNARTPEEREKHEKELQEIIKEYPDLAQDKSADKDAAPVDADAQGS